MRLLIRNRFCFSLEGADRFVYCNGKSAFSVSQYYEGKQLSLNNFYAYEDFTAERLSYNNRLLEELEKEKEK